MIPAWLRDADRRLSWAAALLVGIWVASGIHPITWPDVLRTTQALQFSYPDVYNELHARPFAYCDSYDEQRVEAVAEASVRLDGSLFARMGTYNERMRRHYEADCRVPWRVYQNPANFQKVFAQNYVLYFTVGKLGLSEVHLGLATLIARWLGIFAFAVLCVWAWRSTLAAPAGFALTSVLIDASFARILGVGLPAWPAVTVVPGQALYPLLTVFLALAMVRLVPTGLPALRHPAMWLLPPAFALHAWLYILIDPPVARMLTWLVVGFLAVTAGVRRTWTLAACVVLTAVLQVTVWSWYTAPSRDIYSAVTKYDHITSEAYTPFMMYMGLLERPSPFGLFYMDEVFGWGYDQDPVAGVLAPHLTVHHSYASTGRALFRDAVTTHPVAVAEAVGRRLLVQVFHRPLWYTWDLRVDWVYTLLLGGLLVINGVALLFPRWLLLLTPLSLGFLLNQFAVNTVMTLVHTHTRWNQLGVALMFGAAPLYAFAVAGMVRDWRRTGPPAWFHAWRHSRATGVGLVIVMIVVTAGSIKAHSLLNDERRYLQVWTSVHVRAAELDISAVLDSIDRQRQATGDPDGSLAMWASSLLLLYDARYFSAVPLDESARNATRLRRAVDDADFTYVADGSARENGCWRLDGGSTGLFSYLLASRSQDDVAGARLLVEGEITAGGLTVGLQMAGLWVEAHNVTQPGPFSLVIEPSASGPLSIVIANNQRDGSEATGACLSTIAWVEPSAAAEAAKTRSALRERREAYYRAALAASPDNHLYPFVARFLQIRGWEEHLREGIRRFPDAPYVPGALAALWYHGPGEPRAEDRAAWLYRSDLARRYEAAVARFLQATGAGNPLYVATPVVGTGVLDSEIDSDVDGRRLVRLRLPPGAVVGVSPQPTWQSHLVQLFAYVRIVDGQATASLALEGADGRREVAPVALRPDSQVVTGRYLQFNAVATPVDERFALSIQAGDEGATIELADYYPMLYSPQGYYESPLRSRRSAAGNVVVPPSN